MLPYEPYSAQMSSPDVDLFPLLKEPMRGRRFSSLEELSTEGTRAIRHMNKSGVLERRRREEQQEQEQEQEQ